MAEELYYQSADGGEIRSIPFDQIPSFDTTRNTPITNLNTTVNYAPNGFGTPYTDGWTTIDYTTYDPNEWATTATPPPGVWTTTATPDAPYLQVDGDGFVQWYYNGQPVAPYGWPDSNFTFRYPSESTRHADPKPEPVDTHELDEFIDSLKVAEGEDDV